jgi:hypothetical protein
VLVLVGWLVLRGRRDRLATGAIAAAFVVVLALNVINPDALIARVNIDRAIAGARDLDIEYLSTLSTDAVPAILDHAEGRGCQDLRRVAIDLAANGNAGDFRVFHFSRSRADDLVAAMEADGPC